MDILPTDSHFSVVTHSRYFEGELISLMMGPSRRKKFSCSKENATHVDARQKQPMKMYEVFAAN